MKALHLDLQKALGPGNPIVLHLCHPVYVTSAAGYCKGKDESYKLQHQRAIELIAFGVYLFIFRIYLEPEVGIFSNKCRIQEVKKDQCCSEGLSLTQTVTTAY